MRVFSVLMTKPDLTNVCPGRQESNGKERKSLILQAQHMTNMSLGISKQLIKLVVTGLSWKQAEQEIQR